jgi:hypothetical protein
MSEYIHMHLLDEDDHHSDADSGSTSVEPSTWLPSANRHS